MIPALQDAGLGQLAGIRHGFFGREGGVSQGLYASLNCGWGTRGDAQEHVAANRQRVAAALGMAGAPVVSAKQVHGTDACAVRSPWKPTEAPQADALVTRRPGIVIGVLSADCVPVLLGEERTRVVAAIHAGWRGALAGVVESAVARMVEMGAERDRIRAAVGPAIAHSAYAVGPEFRERFLDRDPASAQLFACRGAAAQWYFDLPGYVHRQLVAAGVGTSAHCGACTYADAQRYFSHRRQTHRGEADYGRQLSAIALVAA